MKTRANMLPAIVPFWVFFAGFLVGGTVLIFGLSIALCHFCG